MDAFQLIPLFAAGNSNIKIYLPSWESITTGNIAHSSFITEPFEYRFLSICGEHNDVGTQYTIAIPPAFPTEFELPGTPAWLTTSNYGIKVASSVFSGITEVEVILE